MKSCVFCYDIYTKVRSVFMQKTKSGHRKSRSGFNSKTSSETVISGERPYGVRGSAGKQTITVKISEGFIVLYVKNALLGNPRVSELYIYIFSRGDGSVWAGDTVKKYGRISGSVVYKWDDSYICVINSMKTYLGDIFLIRPNDLRLFDVISEVNNHRGNISDSLFKLFSKILKE